MLLDPHTATGVRAARKLTTDDQSVICMATAHPAKFTDAIKKILPEDVVSMPKHLALLKDKKEKFKVLPNNIDKVREYILSRVG